ncbi:MAG: hypothetical protein HY509_01645 [Acidobacteria bacterium]|nr:hypothetical protein [Acidobacteriota bacterium]
MSQPRRREGWGRGPRLRGGALLVLLACLGAVEGSAAEKVMVRRDRWFPHPYGAVWDAVVAAVRRGGWEPVRMETGKGILDTGFFEFAEGAFGPSVATQPPELTWEYGYYHKVMLDAGRSRLRISVRPAGSGARVAVHADVEEWNFHRDLREYLWSKRESNGAIEQDLLDRVGEILEPGTKRERKVPVPAD